MNVNHETRKALTNRLGHHLKDLDGEEELWYAAMQAPFMKEATDKVEQMKMKNISMTFDIRSEKTKAGWEKNFQLTTAR